MCEWAWLSEEMLLYTSRVGKILPFLSQLSWSFTSGCNQLSCTGGGGVGLHAVPCELAVGRAFTPATLLSDYEI